MAVLFRAPMSVRAAPFNSIDVLAAHLLATARGRRIDLLPQSSPDGGARVAVFALDDDGGNRDVWLGSAMGDATDPGVLRAALNRAAPGSDQLERAA